MDYIRRANERGAVNMGWLQSNHSFSFGSYYDPKHMGVSVLRVINDDVVQPGAGFGTHGHRDMEIISYVIDGALEHKDSSGNQYIVPAGDVQRMSAGRGVMHSEYNASKTDSVNFLQIWIQPNVQGIAPEYEQKRIEQDGPLTSLINPNGEGGALRINQDASMYRLELAKGESYALEAGKRQGYLHIVKGASTINDMLFNPGDAIAPEVGKTLNVVATEELEALWFDLPTSH